MKKTLLAALALAGIAAYSNAEAQSFGSITAPGTQDVFLGVEDSSGGTQANLVINLGNWSNINSLNGTSISSDLSQVFGSSYGSNASLSYGIFGALGAGFEVSAASTGAFGSGTDGQNAPNKEWSLSPQGTALANFRTQVRSAAAGSLASSGTTLNGVYMSSGDSTSWSAYASGSRSVFGDGNWGSIETGLGSALDMYVVVAGNPNQNGAYINQQVTLGANGTINVVPEPSTYALFGFGALLLVIAYRRKCNS